MPECDPRLTRRLAMMLEDWSPQRQASIPECSRSAAVAKASYRLLSNPRVAAVAVQRSHREATWQRMAGHAVVLAVADTTSFNLTGREQAEGLDPIGFGRGSMQGFLLHVVAALSEQGAMLGVLHTHLWAREKDGKTERQKRAVRKQPPPRAATVLMTRTARCIRAAFTTADRSCGRHSKRNANWGAWS